MSAKISISDKVAEALQHIHDNKADFILDFNLIESYIIDNETGDPAQASETLTAIRTLRLIKSAMLDLCE